MKTTLLAIILALSVQTNLAMAQDRVEIESIVIKGNKEFPQIIYIVPWKDMKTKGQKEQTLVLHSLFGDLFDPVDLKMGNVGQVQTKQK
jgi:hypothetical protein